MRPTLVGMMPSAGNKGLPLCGRIGRRLLTWARLPGGSIRDHFWTNNLNHRHRAGGKLDPREAVYVRRQITQGQPLVLCGRDVAAYWGMQKVPFYQWVGQVVVIPHPSSRCRIYNNRHACTATGLVLRRALLLAGKKKMDSLENV